MIFKKKKPKLNSKVRFQHKNFTGKLQTARNYKRTALAIPETKLEKFLSNIGLGSKIMQIVLGLVILGLVYLVYFPNFLTLEKITITGLSDSQTKDFENAIKSEIADSNFLYPEKNLLFLRNKTILDAANNLPNINKVEKVSRNISHRELIISTESKYEKFLVATPGKVYDVYNDGLLKGEAGIGIDRWQDIDNPKMIKLELSNEVSSEKYVQFLNPELVKYLDNLNTRLDQIRNLKVAYYKFKDAQEVVVKPAEGTEQTLGGQTEIKEEPIKSENQPLTLPINSAEVHAVIYKTDSLDSYQVIFDATKDVQKSIDNLKLLLSQTTPDRLAQLNYIDLRLEERAYLCLQGAACNK